MDEQQNKALATNLRAEGSGSSKLKAAPLRSLRLFDSRTPRTSASVRGRWTAEFQVIKAALSRQRTAKNKALRGPNTCSCCHIKGPTGHSTGLAAAAAHASEAFTEVALPTPRKAKDKKSNSRLWVPGLAASSIAAAAEAPAATGALQESNANRRRLLGREGLHSPEAPAARPPHPPVRVPAFLWREYFDAPISKAALSYKEAAGIVLPPSRAREATRASLQSETNNQQQAGRQVPPLSFFLTFLDPPVLKTAASPAKSPSLGSTRRYSSSPPSKQVCPSSVSFESGRATSPLKGFVRGPQHKKRVSDAAPTADASLRPSKGADGKPSFPANAFWRKSIDPPQWASGSAAGNSKSGKATAANRGCQEGVRSLAAEFLQKLSLAKEKGLETTLGSGSQSRCRSEERRRERGVLQPPHHSVELSCQRSKAPHAALSDCKGSRHCGGKEDSAKVIAVKEARQATNSHAIVTHELLLSFRASTRSAKTALPSRPRRRQSPRGNNRAPVVDSPTSQPVGIPRLQLHEVHQSYACSCISSSRRLPTLQEFIDGQRHLEEVASEAAEGKPQDLLLIQLLSSCLSESTRVGSSSTSSSPSGGSGTASQASVKLEKLLAEVDEAFWVSHKLDRMVGWLPNRARRATSAGRRRKSSIVPLPAAAGRGTLSPELLQQKLQQLVARSALAAGRSAAAGSDEQQTNPPGTATGRSRQHNKGKMKYSQMESSLMQLLASYHRRSSRPTLLSILLSCTCESLRARSEARESAKRTLAALLSTRTLCECFDSATRLSLMQQMRIGFRHEQHFAFGLLKRFETRKRANTADFVESWYTDLLATAAAGLAKDGRGGAERESPTVTKPVQELLELIRESLHVGLQYQALIDFVCTLEETEVQARLSKVLIKSSLAFEDPLAELRKLVNSVKMKFGSIPPTLQSQLICALRCAFKGRGEATHPRENESRSKTITSSCKLADFPSNRARHQPCAFGRCSRRT
ncbi:hypothetical protein Esti_002284 [Eimeria stiedai]